MNADWFTPASPDTSANGNRMYPACAIPEYASSRTAWRWRSATRFPSVIVSTDSSAKIGAQNSHWPTNATNISCSRPANPAAAEATARNPATGTGEPS